MAAHSVLDLSTLVDPTHAQIDGAFYVLRHPESLSLFQLKRVETYMPRIGALLQQDHNTAEEEAEVARLLDVVCRDVLDAPPEVHARLSDVQRLAIVDAFTKLRVPTRAQASGARTT